MSKTPETATPVREVALIGLGAIGILYAAPFSAAAGGRFRVIADAGRVARYRAEPPRLNGRVLNLGYEVPAPGAKPADLIVIAVKAAGLAASLEAIAPFVAGHTQLLPLLNGVSAQEAVAAAYGRERTLHGFVYCDSSMREGRSVVQSGRTKLVFGEAENDPPAPRVRAVADWLEAAGVDYQIPADMRFAQWRKFILNVGINQAQALFRTASGGLHANPEAMAFARALMDEAAAVGTALGIGGLGELPAWGGSVIRAAAPDSKTSMLQDIEAGRTTEVDLFAATVCRLGRAHGVSTPANERVVRQLNSCPAS